MKLYLVAEPEPDNYRVINYRILYCDSFDSSTIFYCNSEYQIFNTIDQLQPVEHEIVSLCIKLYENEKSELTWELDILPILRNHKIINIIDTLLL